MGCFDGVADFRIGASPDESVYMDGRIDEVGFWKRILTAGEKTELYQSGFGNQYPFTISTVTKQIKPAGGGDYTSLLAWEAARQGNLIGRNTIERALCFGGNLSTAGFTISGSDTDSTKYMLIEVDSTAKHSGVRSTDNSIAYISAGANTAITIMDDNVKIRDLSIQGTGSGPGISVSSALLAIVERCIIHGWTESVQASSTSTVTSVSYTHLTLPTNREV